MGLFDILENEAGSLLSGQGAQPGGTSQTAAVAAIAQVLQSHPGGVGGLVDALEQCGLGAAAQSWLSPGANQPVSADQIQSALPNAVSQVAAQLGVDPAVAAGHMANLLPQILAHVGANGQAPADGGMAALTSLLSRLGSSPQ